MSSDNPSPVTILVAEDDADDRLFIKDAFEQLMVMNEVKFVENGEELLQDLGWNNGQETKLNYSILPLIFLDLNMPKMDGRDTLRILKTDPVLKPIPVIVLTTSSADEDIIRAYDIGVNSFISKPMTFDKFLETIRSVTNYWFQVVKLPVS